MHFNPSVLMIAVALAGLGGASVYAQSTIFNVPSTDAVARGSTYVEFDFISHLASHDNGGFQTPVPRAIWGLGKGVEAGVNLAVTHSTAPTLVYLQPNVKWQAYANQGAGTAVSVGAIAYTPLKDRSENDSYGFFYGNVSKKFEGRYGPRLTAGGYGLADYELEGADKAGVMLGYEQPIFSNTSFVADWFSGENGFGYVTPGFSFVLPGSGLLNLGYSIGNSGHKNNALFVYYGVTF